MSRVGFIHYSSSNLGGIMAKGGGRGNGACGGTQRRDGSGGGKGNRGTKRQPKGRK